MPQDSLKEQIYGSEKRLSNNIANINSNEKITKENKDTITDFVSHAKAKGLSAHRISIYLRTFKIFSERTIKPFKELDKRDMERIFADIHSLGHAGWTIETYKKNIKYIYRWLFELDSSDALPPAVKWIKGEKPPSQIQREDLPTAKEVKMLIDSTPNLMYKAMVSVLYDGSLRPGELLNLRIKNVFFNNEFITLKIKGKMEKKQGTRDVHLFESCDLLHSWLETHPFKDNPEHPLWIVTMKKKQYGKPITLRFLNLFIERYGKKAGIKKRLYPYLFRHAKGTELYKEYGEAIAKKIMGHTPDSKMASVYNHLNDDDVLERMKEKHGIKTRKEHDDIDKETCKLCGHTNSYGSSLCSKCKKPLGKDAMLNVMEAHESKDKIDKLLKLADLIEKTPKIMEILEDQNFQKQQAERLSKTK